MNADIDHIRKCMDLLEESLRDFPANPVDGMRKRLHLRARNVTNNYVVEKRFHPDGVPEETDAAVLDILNRAADALMTVPDSFYGDLETYIIDV